MQVEVWLRFWLLNLGTKAIHIIIGSVLDINRDGKRDNDANYTWWVDGEGDVAIPSHYYAVVVRCVTGDGMECQEDQLDAIGLLFQHPTELGVCESNVEVLKDAVHL